MFSPTTVRHVRRRHIPRTNAKKVRPARILFPVEKGIAESAAPATKKKVRCRNAHACQHKTAFGNLVARNPCACARKIIIDFSMRPLSIFFADHRPPCKTATQPANKTRKKVRPARFLFPVEKGIAESDAPASKKESKVPKRTRLPTENCFRESGAAKLMRLCTKK